MGTGEGVAKERIVCFGGEEDSNEAVEVMCTAMGVAIEAV